MNSAHGSAAMQGRTGVLSPEIGPFTDQYLALAAQAESAYARFVYSTEQQADHYRRLLFERGVAEHCPPAARLLLVAGAPVGIIALAEPALLAKRRLATAWLLSRDAELQRDAAALRRMRLSASTFVTVGQGDLYISRIAVDASVAGKGYGARLLDEAVSEAQRIGASRLVLDVAMENARAIAFYERNGFATMGESSSTDAPTGRTLGHLHLARSVSSTTD